jgi:predicted alpha/beta superfamily hydrolase
MAAYLGSYGPAGYGGDDLPRPGTVVMQYTGHTDYTKDDPPTFAVVGENDGIANWRTMEQRVNNLKAAGIDTEFYKYPNLGHGFGLGIGTTAEGWLYDATRFWEKHMTKATPMTDRHPVPQELVNIPEAYYQSAGRQGALAELSYNTYESKTYEQKSMALTKRAIVYLPYGYSEENKYNVFYLMHGGWGNETSTLGTPNRPNPFKNVIDNAIENGDIEPLIIVCPTYNNTSSEDSASFGLALELTGNYHNELINDLIPAVESKYSTYAENLSLQGLMKSRDHRGFGGFSMGSVATWRTFQYGLDYFRYFLPMSCGTSLDEENIFAAAKNHDQSDYFVWVITGTEDFAYRYDENRVEQMRNSPYFTESDSARSGNFAYRVKTGYSHDGLAAMEYTYNGLLWFWKQ